MADSIPETFLSFLAQFLRPSTKLDQFLSGVLGDDFVAGLILLVGIAIVICLIASPFVARSSSDEPNGAKENSLKVFALLFAYFILPEEARTALASVVIFASPILFKVVFGLGGFSLGLLAGRRKFFGVAVVFAAGILAVFLSVASEILGIFVAGCLVLSAGASFAQSLYDRDRPYPSLLFAITAFVLAVVGGVIEIDTMCDPASFSCQIVSVTLRYLFPLAFVGGFIASFFQNGRQNI